MESRKDKKKKDRVRQRNIIRNRIIVIGVAWILLILVVFLYKELTGVKEANIKEQSLEVKENKEGDVKKEEIKSVLKEQIIISAAGDCTLGTDTKFSTYGSFQEEVKKYGNDYSHFMKNVAEVFRQDDYTLVNLETTFTSSTVKADKGSGVAYHFKGPKEYVNILTSSSIDGVTIDNNHIYDYGKQGIDDTINVLKENRVDYCGRGNKIIKEIKGIKIGILGYSSFWISDELKNNIKNDIAGLKNEGCTVVIPYFHWGNENNYEPSNDQIAMARFAIDSGADMVLGSHPHVIQSLEKYKDKLIAYSLGNFSFGGNSNPTDKRTLILQVKFNLEDKVIKATEFKIIPTMISSVQERNDYVPTPAIGNNAIEIIKKLNELSPTIRGKINLEFFSL